MTSIFATFGQKENLVYTSSLDKTVRIWNEKGECTRVIEATDVGWIWEIVVVLASDRVYFAGQFGVKIYNFTTSKWAPLSFAGHTKQTSCLVVKGEILHTGSWDRTIRGWKEKGRRWRTTQNLKDIENFYSGRSGSIGNMNVPKNPPSPSRGSTTGVV